MTMTSRTLEILTGSSNDLTLYEGDTWRAHEHALITRMQGWDDESYSVTENPYPATLGSYMGASVANISSNIREVRFEAVIKRDTPEGRRVERIGSWAAYLAQPGHDEFTLRRTYFANGRVYRREQLAASLASIDFTEEGDSYRVTFVFDCFNPRKVVL